MAKLTETTKDQLKAKSDSIGGPVRIDVAHEPLRGEPFPQLSMQMVSPQPQQSPLQLPTIPLPPKQKRTRKAKEQTVNQPQLKPVMPALQPLKIALVGTAPSSRVLTPCDDPTWHIWACSPGNMNMLKRIDAWFEVHGTILAEPEEQHYAPQYVAWMNSLTIPLFMQDQRVCAKAISIPKDALIADFGPYFFTSSFSWMMAMAIKEIERLPMELRAQSEIRLFGIDMASREEYIIQRPGAYYFFIEAAKRGITISAPDESDILQPPPLYGYSEVTPYGVKLRRRKLEIQARIAPMEQQLRQLQETITYLKGAVEDLDYQMCIQGGVHDNAHTHLPYLARLKQQAVQSVPISLTATSQSHG